MSARPSSDVARTLFQLLLIGGLIAGGFWILSPFLAAFGWAATMVVATWPLLLRVQAALGGRRSARRRRDDDRAAAGSDPAALRGDLDNRRESRRRSPPARRRSIEFAGSPPPSWVERLPLVGSSLASEWRTLAAAGPAALSERLVPQIRDITSWLLAEVGGVGSIMIQFLLAIGIAAVLYMHGETAAAGLRRFARRVGGEQTESALELAGQAVRAVALGVGVTAIVQSLLAGIGLAVAGIPFAGALTAVVFVLCVAQLGPALVLLPAIGWLYWQGQTAWATALLVWAIPVVTLDNFLRPVLIKRGADLPLLLILPGVIGGLIAFGVIGLFIGPVLLAVGYTLLVAWVEDGETAR